MQQSFVAQVPSSMRPDYNRINRHSFSQSIPIVYFPSVQKGSNIKTAQQQGNNNFVKKPVISFVTHSNISTLPNTCKLQEKPVEGQSYAFNSLPLQSNVGYFLQTPVKQAKMTERTAQNLIMNSQKQPFDVYDSSAFKQELVPRRLEFSNNPHQWPTKIQESVLLYPNNNSNSVLSSYEQATQDAGLPFPYNKPQTHATRHLIDLYASSQQLSRLGEVESPVVVSETHVPNTRQHQKNFEIIFNSYSSFFTRYEAQVKELLQLSDNIETITNEAQWSDTVRRFQKVCVVMMNQKTQLSSLLRDNRNFLNKWIAAVSDEEFKSQNLLGANLREKSRGLGSRYGDSQQELPITMMPQYIELEKENLKLQSRVNNLQMNNFGKSELKEYIEQLQRQNSQLIADVNNLKHFGKQNEYARSAIDHLQRTAQGKEDQFRACNQMLVRANQEVTILQHRCKQMKESIQRKELSCDGLKNELKLAQKKTQQQIYAKQQYQLTKSKELREIQVTLENVSQALRNKQAETFKLKSEITNIEQKNSNLRIEVANKKIEIIKQWSQKMAEKDIQLDQATATIRTIELQLQRISEQNKTLVEKYKQRVAVTTAETKVIRFSTRSLNKNKSEYLNSTASNQAQLSVIGRLDRQQIVSLTEQLKKTNQEIIVLRREKTSIKEKLQQAQREIDILEKQNQKKRRIILELNQEISQMKTVEYELQALKSNVAKKRRQVSEQVSKVQGINADDARKYQIQNQILLRQIQQLTQQRDRDQRLLKKIETQFAQKHIQVKMHQSATTLDESIPNDKVILEGKINKLQEQLIAMKNTNKDLNICNQEISLKAMDDVRLEKIKSCNLENVVTGLKQTNSDMLIKMNQMALKINRQRNIEEKEYCKAERQLKSKISQLVGVNNRLTQKLQKTMSAHQSQVSQLQRKIANLELKSLQTQSQLSEMRVKEQQRTRTIELLIAKSNDRNKANSQLEISNAQLKSKLAAWESRIKVCNCQIQEKNEQLQRKCKRIEEITKKSKQIVAQYNTYRQKVLRDEEKNCRAEIAELVEEIVINNQYRRHNPQTVFSASKLMQRPSNEQRLRQKTTNMSERSKDELQLRQRSLTVSSDKLQILLFKQAELMRQMYNEKPESHQNVHNIDSYIKRIKQLQQLVDSHIRINKDLSERLNVMIQNERKSMRGKLITNQQVRVEEDYGEKIINLRQENRQLKCSLNRALHKQVENQVYAGQIAELNLQISKIAKENVCLSQELIYLKNQSCRSEAPQHQSTTIQIEQHVQLPYDRIRKRGTICQDK